MKASIIIPCYKHVQYLPEAVDSALAQTYNNFDIIIINDGSPDNTREVAEDYAKKHKNIRVINQSNKGLASARNSAIINSDSQVILPLDADDKIDKTYLEKTIKKMIDNPSVGIVGTDMQIFGEQDVLLRLTRPTTLENLKVNNQLFVCSLIRREAINQCGGYNPKMDRLGGFEDWDMWIDIVKRGWGVEYVAEPLFYYRRRSGGMADQTIGREKELKEQIMKNHPELYE